MIGQSVRHYEILEEIGRGGMGVVYRARDTKLNRTVALKFLPQQLTADDESTARFVREAQAAAAIEHPNICTIFEISEAEDGQTFIAMGHYGGKTLDNGQWSVGSGQSGEIVSIVMQILEGLSAAHKAGIVHRDIKPANIILGDDGRVRILDFGLAKLASGIDITKDGTTSGTAAYMSPEQVNGDVVDGRSDLWSLGVMLFEMLAGKRPFHGEYDQAISYAIVNKEAESIRDAAPDSPTVLLEVVEKALKKDPAERFQSADEFIEALSPLVAPAAVSGTFLDMLKQPKVAIPLAAAVIILAIFGWSWYDTLSKEKWAREEALPEIIRLTDSRERAAAFRLLVEAQPYLEGDLTQERWYQYVMTRAWFATDPPGADVSWKRYDEPDDMWTSVGVTPVDSVSFPQETVRIRYQKDGYRPVTRLVFGGHHEIELAKIESTDTEVVEIPGGAGPLLVVGIDHNPAQEFQTFEYDQFEVTNAKYKAFVDAGGYEDPTYWDALSVPFEEAMARFRDRSNRPGPSTWEAGGFPAGQADYPVAGVSWFEAMAYATWAGRALPTVYHWNAAAYTPASYIIVPGNNFTGDGPHPVGSNNSIGWFGQYDFPGNVREWTYNLGANGQRFILGGGWTDPTYAYNDAYSQDAFDRSETNGFRTINYLDEEPNLAALQAPLDQPFRDYSKEEPVSDAEFEAIRRIYDYDRTPLNATIEAEDDSSDVWIHQTVTIDAAYGDGDERVILHVFLPKSGSPPYQTVVFFPGSNGIHDRSFDATGGTMGFLDFLGRDGRAFVWPIYKGTYERGTDLDSDYPNSTVRYRDHVTWWVKDLRRSIDYLESRDDIDADNLAYFGWSWGGAQAPIMTALEPRFKSSVLLVAGLMMQKSPPETDPLNFLPRVKAPTLMLNGRFDFYFPLETSQKPFYENLGVPGDQKRMVVSDLGHTVTREELMRESFAWLDRWLDEYGR